MMPPNDTHSEEESNAAALALLRELPEPAAAATERVARRLARTQRAAPLPRTTPSPWLVAGLGCAIAAASAAVALRVGADPGTSPEGAGPLASDSVWAGRRLTGVDLTYRGSGDVDGSDQAPRIDWQRGTLNVEVTPGLGLDVRVNTREAEVRVVGTGFTVTRDALGTRVEVRHGIVETSCVGESAVQLQQGDSVTCAPQSAAGLLGRAQALREARADAALVAQSLEAGLALTSLADPIGAELGAMQVQLYAEAGRNTEALESAHRLLSAGGSGREEELILLAGAVARASGGCAEAAPWLLDLDSRGVAACGDN